MTWMHPDALEYRRKRWNKPDDGRWTRPDAARWLKPDPERWLSPVELQAEYPELYERKYGSVLRRPASPPPPNQLDIIRSDETLRLRALHLLRGAQVQIAMLRLELALRRKSLLRPQHYLVQPRVPIGNPDGGQWTSEGAEQPHVDLVSARGRTKGHHYVPAAVFNKFRLPQEIRRVFETARTGAIPDAAVNYYDKIAARVSP